MPRPLRPIADGLIYHVINRGNNRQTVFDSDGDYAAFLKAIADLKERRQFDLYGYCLMGNPIHLLIRPRDCSISRIAQSLLVSHTQRYHRFHRSSGHVWQGRFKSPVIQDDDHLLTVLRYIEANPLARSLWSARAITGGAALPVMVWAVAIRYSTRSWATTGWQAIRRRDSGVGRPTCIGCPRRKNWRPSVAAARRDCPTVRPTGWIVYAGN